MPGSFLLGKAPNGSDTPIRVDEDGNLVTAIDGDVQFNADLETLESSVAAIEAKLPELTEGSQPVAPVGIADAGNSTTANLAGGASFIGTGIEASPKYGTISVCVLSSHNSAVNGLKFQVSIDNVEWQNIEQYSYVAANGLKSYSFSPSGKYFRVNYTNGATATTKLAIFTVLRTGAVKASSHRIKDNIDGEHDAELVKAVLSAERPDGSFTDINATQGGNLKISLEEVNGIDSLPTTVPARIPTTTSVSSSDSSVTILASNVNRRGVSFANDSTATLRLSFSTPATNTNAFIVLSPGSFILLDQQLIVTNAIYGIWSAVNGTAQVTEYV